MTVDNTLLLDIWWNMLIKFVKQIANTCERGVRRCSTKKRVLKKFVNSLLKKESLAQVISGVFCEIFKKTSFYSTPPVTFSVLQRQIQSPAKHLR